MHITRIEHYFFLPSNFRQLTAGKRQLPITGIILLLHCSSAFELRRRIQFEWLLHIANTYPISESFCWKLEIRMFLK
ncbi:hypothetical protein Csa_011268 [Cucumis sativus]|uniref:Uncharacterized protein n=1 Tax=Cucumis sativus TaxID=3659 RepID=A0A0A0L5Y7_CUCSA|nr:hypothetical protein Csa_011268 [Cucumis sativus]